MDFPSAIMLVMFSASGISLGKAASGADAASRRYGVRRSAEVEAWAPGLPFGCKGRRLLCFSPSVAQPFYAYARAIKTCRFVHGAPLPDRPTLDAQLVKRTRFASNLAIGMPSKIRIFYAVKRRWRIKMVWNREGKAPWRGSALRKCIRALELERPA